MPPKEYRGRLSQGCDFCRQQKMKCDGAKPVCGRCIKSSRSEQCRYRNLTEMMFRNETSDTVHKAHKAWRERTKQNLTETRRANKSPPKGAERPEAGSPERLASLPYNVEELAINRFIFDYVCPMQMPGKGPAGIFDYVPNLVAKASENSALQEAFLGVAFANFDRHIGFTINNRARVDKHYQKALQKVAQDLQNPVLASSDGLMQAVQFLSMYEQMSTGGDNSSALKAHGFGLAALMKLRNVSSFDEQYKWSMYQNINLQMLSACLRCGMPSFMPFKAMKEFYDRSSFPMIRPTALIHQGVDLLALWKTTHASFQEDFSEQDSVLTQLITLETAMEGWESNAPEIAGFSVQAMPLWDVFPKWLHPVLDHPGVPKTFQEYQSFQTIYVWNLWRMTRMLVVRVLLNASLQKPELDSAPYLRTIELMVEDTLGSVLPILTATIHGKPHANELSQMYGFRTFMAIFPLNAAKICMQVLPPTQERLDRTAWTDHVFAWVMNTFHGGRRSNFLSANMYSSF